MSDHYPIVSQIMHAQFFKRLDEEPSMRDRVDEAVEKPELPASKGVLKWLKGVRKKRI